jgi:2'-5' RNA ligase
MSEKKRCFVAVRFSDEVVSALDRQEGRLRESLNNRLRVKWVPPANIHLTLQFLGDVDLGLIPKLADGLAGAFGDVAPFEVWLRGLGVFPSARRPRVLWMGIRAGADQLKALAACTHRVTLPLGFEPEDRPFRAHVTLGRVKDHRKSLDISGVFERLADAEAGRCQIDMVHLVASELRPTGPIYNTLDSFPLGR